jgi:drug/metabolite transporter (DMT)-like permease
MILGYLFAVLGALGSGIGSVLESIGVRRSGAYGGDNDDLGKIARQPLYWTGVTIDVAAFVCAAIALHRLPLFLVQSVMAFSVGVTAVVSVLLGIRLGRRGWWALLVAVLGLVLLGISAQTGPALALPHGWRWILLATAVPVAAIGLFGSRTNQRWTVSLLAFGAGLGFTAVAVSARTLHVDGSWQGILGEPGAWAIAANGVVATAVFAMALQKGSATTASAVMFSTNTVLPSAIGLALLHDSIRPGFVAWGVLGFLLAVSGAVALAHYSEVAESMRQKDHATRQPMPDAV